MKIRFKYYEKIIDCDVSSIDCKKYQCLAPHKYTHRNSTMNGSVNPNQDKFYSCANRNYHGCPDKPKIKEK